MLKDWQFNVLFFVGVGGAVLLLIGPDLGLNIGSNPMTVSGVGTILAYVLTQRKTLTNAKHDEKKTPENASTPNPDKEVEDDGVH